MPARSNQLLAWVGNNLGLGEVDQVAIVVDQLVGGERRQTLRVQEQIVFHFITHHLRQNELGNPCRTKRQRGLVESPGRDNSSGQDIGVQKETDSPLASHLPRWVRERRRAAPAAAFPA